MKPKAFLFDLNGTMVNDMEYHITGWHKILNELGAGITLEQMKLECYGKNQELLERIFPGRFTEAEKDKMILEKEMAYQQAFRPKLELIKGLHQFLERARVEGIKMAICSAAILFNIDFVIDGTRIRHYFDALVSADEVQISKPDPETFLIAAERLKILPSDCIVFEDSPKGVEAALNAGMKCFVITTMHEPSEFKQHHNIIGFGKDFTEFHKMIFSEKLSYNISA